MLFKHPERCRRSGSDMTVTANGFGFALALAFLVLRCTYVRDEWLCYVRVTNVQCAAAIDLAGKGTWHICSETGTARAAIVPFLLYSTPLHRQLFGTSSLDGSQTTIRSTLNGTISAM